MKRAASLTYAVWSTALCWGIQSVQATAPINLAPAGTSTASSAAFGSAVIDATDGNRDGVFGNGSVWHSDGGDAAQTYNIDLGANYFLDRIQILPRTDQTQNSVENFRLSVFADDGGGNPGASLWTDTFLTAQAANQAWGTTEPSGIQGRHVRFERLDRDPTFTTFAEIEVWGQSNPMRPNLTLSGAITGSAAGFGTALADGSDNDINGAYGHPEHGVQQGSTSPIYHSGTQAVGQFWQVDLGSEQLLDFVELIGRNENNGGVTTTEFRLSVLDAGLNELYATTIANDAANRNANYDHTIDLSTITGQHLRIETTRNEFLAFSELRVFGAVPEPSSFILFVIGGILVGVTRRKR